MFSLDQVRDIVTRTVEARERVLRQEYDRVLQQKLQEQWASFAKFNEDYRLEDAQVVRPELFVVTPYDAL